MHLFIDSVAVRYLCVLAEGRAAPLVGEVGFLKGQPLALLMAKFFRLQTNRSHVGKESVESPKGLSGSLTGIELKFS